MSGGSSTHLNSEAWWPKEGWTSILVHNYGGRRKSAYSNDSIRKLLVEFPAHILVLQEHDPSILLSDDRRNFHVCLGLDERGDETYLAVIARKHDSVKGTPCIAKVNLLECRTIIAKGT